MNKELKENFIEWLEEANLFCFEIEHCKACPYHTIDGCRLMLAFKKLTIKPQEWDIGEIERLL